MTKILSFVKLPQKAKKSSLGMCPYTHSPAKELIKIGLVVGNQLIVYLQTIFLIQFYRLCVHNAFTSFCCLFFFCCEKLTSCTHREHCSFSDMTVYLGRREMFTCCFFVHCLYSMTLGKRDYCLPLAKQIKPFAYFLSVDAFNTAIMIINRQTRSEVVDF